MIRISALRNLPVIAGNRQIGYSQGFCLDHPQKKVHALIISRGMRGKCAVMSDQIQSISERFILVKEICRFSRSFEQDSCRFVRDTSGLLVGRITDYALDPETMILSAVEFMSGFLPPERKGRIWMLDYRRISKHDLSIPSLVCDEPTFSMEGN